MKLLIHSQTSRSHRWSLWMDKWFQPGFYWAFGYLSMLGLKLIHLNQLWPLLWLSYWYPAIWSFQYRCKIRSLCIKGHLIFNWAGLTWKWCGALLQYNEVILPVYPIVAIRQWLTLKLRCQVTDFNHLAAFHNKTIFWCINWTWVTSWMQLLLRAWHCCRTTFIAGGAVPGIGNWQIFQPFSRFWGHKSSLLGSAQGRHLCPALSPNLRDITTRVTITPPEIIVDLGAPQRGPPCSRTCP